MDSKLWESWLTLAVEGLRGAERSRQALEALGNSPLTPEAVNAWVAQWIPAQGGAGALGGAPPDFARRVEEWWKTCGVVPKNRYLALLREHEALKARVDELQATVRNLRELLAAGGGSPPGDAREGWEDVASRLAEAQVRWARLWMDALSGDAGERAPPAKKEKA